MDNEKMIIISDSSPLISLAVIGKLNLRATGKAQIKRKTIWY